MKDNMFDTRLYNQVTGTEQGFKNDDDYDLYDKPLFADRTSSSIYKNLKTSSSIDDGNEEININESKKLIEKISQRGKMFEGADLTHSEGGKPVEFEKSNDDYGLSQNNHKKARK